MPEGPLFTVDTPRRCFGCERSSPGTPCGARAIWMVPPVNGSPAQFYCDRHRQNGVVPIALDAPYRRVSLTVEVLITAANLIPSAAHGEVVTVVLDALARLGAVPNLVNVTSTIGRYSPPPAPVAAPRLGRSR